MTSYEKQMQALGIERGQLGNGFQDEPTYYTPVKAEKQTKQPVGKRVKRPLTEDYTNLKAERPAYEKLRRNWLTKPRKSEAETQKLRKS